MSLGGRGHACRDRNFRAEDAGPPKAGQFVARCSLEESPSADRNLLRDSGVQRTLCRLLSRLRMSPSGIGWERRSATNSLPISGAGGRNSSSREDPSKTHGRKQNRWKRKIFGRSKMSPSRLKRAVPWLSLASMALESPPF